MKINNDNSIQSFLSTVYTLLLSSGDLALERLEESFMNMHPIVHEHCNSKDLDISAMVYASFRLPASIMHTQRILFGQSERIFNEHGFFVQEWDDVVARARCRRYKNDGRGTLASFIESRSDIDDLIPMMLTFQIEWNKIHTLLLELPEKAITTSWYDENALLQVLRINSDDLNRIKMIWGKKIGIFLREARARQCKFLIRNLGASFCSYRRESDEWWVDLVKQCSDIEERPVYFVSSNTHSFVNIFSGFAIAQKENIVTYLESQRTLDSIHKEWKEALEKGDTRKEQNLLYYLLKKFSKSGTLPKIFSMQREHEYSVGITHIFASRSLRTTQIIDLGRLSMDCVDRSLCGRDLSFLKESDALILNIDYPLGKTAYFILSKIAERASELRGIYIIGKAASLSADSGDILIPEQVYDQHTQNTYSFENSLARGQFEPFLEKNSGAVFDRQKAITVLGTYTQNRSFIDMLITHGFSDIEMESGPYLSAIYEMLHPKRYPEGKSITYRASEIELGIVHYVSDNPVRGKKLGDSNLSLAGVAPTYAATLTVAQRIFDLEYRRNAQ